MKYYEDVNEQARRYSLHCYPKSNQSACVWDDEIRPMLAKAYLKGYEDAGKPLEKYPLLDIDREELFKALDSQTEKILAAKERIMEREVERELAKLKDNERL